MTETLPRTIKEEAALWLMRRRAAVTLQEEHAFAAWLDADPRHGEALERMRGTLSDIAALQSLAALAPLGDDEDLFADERHTEAPAAPRPRRTRAVAVITALAAALVAAIGLNPGLLDRPDARAETAVAEMRVLHLPDGSKVTLGPASRLDLRFAGDERRVTLATGEAFFEVARDPSRPFLVDAGGAQVRVLGTKFDVNLNAGKAKVAVLEGVVQVREDAPLFAKAPVRTLEARQQLEARASAPIVAIAEKATAPALVLPAVAPAGSWRHGRLTYHGTPLAEVVADINRYYAPGVILADEALADRRVAASFRTDEIADFVEGLPTMLPAKVARTANGALTIQAASQG